jgi:hypothetical protein
MRLLALLVLLLGSLAGPVSPAASAEETLTVEPATATVTATASCGNRRTLDVTAGALQASLTDGTSVSTSSCSASVPAPAGTTVGTALCDIKELICALDCAIDERDLARALELLDQVLSSVDSTLT